MTIDFDADLNAVFSSDDFGEIKGTVFHNGVEIDFGHFDDMDRVIQMGEGDDFVMQEVKFTSKSSLFPKIAEGDDFVARGVKFKVAYWLNDGTGVIEIYMERVKA